MLKGIIINNSVEFNFAQSHVRENKSGEIFPQYYTSGFGEIFPWRKFPAIRYIVLLFFMYFSDVCMCVSVYVFRGVGVCVCVCVCVCV